MTEHTVPLNVQRARLKDAFWSREADLARTAVLPYQWEALNDRVPDAAPSYWMHNMRAAARVLKARAAGCFQPRQPLRGMVEAPEEGKAAEPDCFYGWVFQDSDGYKWLEAVAYQLARAWDDTLYAHAQEAISAIAQAQEPDGYLDTYYTLHGREHAFTNLMLNHELYCLGHLLEAAVAWHQATGEEELLQIGRRFAGCVAERFGPGRERGCPGHEIAEMALIRLWEETGEEQWLRLACFMLDVRGEAPSTFALEENRRRAEQGQPPLPVDASRYTYFQADRPVREATEAVGHAVRQMYLLCGMADAARVTGDEAMTRACERLWRSVTEEKLYVTGGVGATHVGEAFSRPFDLPADTAYSETCAAIGLVFFARRMLQLRPEARYADVMELALYNTALAGISLSGQRFFYVNPLAVEPGACDTDERLRHVKPERQKWFGCACCPPNIARLLSSVQTYICTTSLDTVYIHLYIGSELDVELNGQALTLALDADLMRDGHVTLRVLSGRAEGTIALREPAWTQDAVFDGGGKQQGRRDGYVTLTGLWQAGDTITVELPMPVRALQANPRVTEAADQICFARGPLVYCAEAADNGPALGLIRVRPESAAQAEVIRMGLEQVDLPALRLPAQRLQAGEETPLYRVWREPETASITLTLVPYFAWNNRGRGEMRVWQWLA